MIHHHVKYVWLEIAPQSYLTNQSCYQLDCKQSRIGKPNKEGVLDRQKDSRKYVRTFRLLISITSLVRIYRPQKTMNNHAEILRIWINGVINRNYLISAKIAPRKKLQMARRSPNLKLDNMTFQELYLRFYRKSNSRQD